MHRGREPDLSTGLVQVLQTPAAAGKGGGMTVIDWIEIVGGIGGIFSAVYIITYELRR